MSKKFKLLVVLMLAATATVGVMLTAGASSEMACGESGIGGNPQGVAIKKNAFCQGERSWDWSILKTGSHSELTLSEGQIFTVNYQVDVDATLTESYTVSGNIFVHNLTAEPITVTGVTDSLGAVDCGVTFPFELGRTGPTGDVDPLRCTYSATTSSQPAKNVATVFYNEGLKASVELALDWSGVEIPETDECVDVYEKFGDEAEVNLGEVCRGDHTFKYSKQVGPYSVCGSYKVANAAKFVTQDTGAHAASSWVVDVEVPCQLGCTLTPGYWKTHSAFGPAPYDDTWASIGESTPFFYSGQSYYDVLWTAPSGGNAYYILAHAYIAAELNQLNGADFTAASSAFAEATALFNDAANTPDTIGGLRGRSRSQWLNLAETLDDYNNGLIGPGHCSE